MFKSNHRQYFSSEINSVQSQLEYFKSSKDYIDLISFFTVTYRIICDPELFYNNFMLINSKYGIIAEFLENRKKRFLLLSSRFEDVYCLPFKYRDSFKLVNWQNNQHLKLFFKNELLIDFNFIVDNLDQLIYFISFLDLNYNPLLVLLNHSNLDNSIIIDFFNNHNYEYLLDKKENIVDILKTKITTIDLNQLLIFNYIPPKIIKEDIGLCLEQ